MDEANEFESRVSRRAFFNIVGWGGLGAFFGTVGFASARYFYPKVLYEPRTTFIAGKPEEYPGPTEAGKVIVDERFKESQRVWIIRNTEGIYALVGVCTHLGCTPNWFLAENKFKCPCHGTNYNIEGEVIAGPAPEPLYRAKISLAPDGSMVITTGLLGIRRPNLQAKKKVITVKWVEEEWAYIKKAPYFLPLKA
ncbi:MAG: ubiquinol-cytochrome c reductase iron-sulfur subunit [Nitrospinota bacterium]